MLQCLVLAGGSGTRMRPATDKIPKSLLPVAGKPFVEWQLSLLARAGIERVVFAAGYLGDLLEDHVGDGGRWALEVRYVHEGDRLLGTAGAIRLAFDTGVLDEEFFVLYGDSYLPIDYVWVAEVFRSSRAPALMTVFHNADVGDRSNVVFDGCRVECYDKSTEVRPERMLHIDYGLSVFDRELIAREVPAGRRTDLAPVLTRLARSGLLAGLEVFTPFYEVGSPSGLSALETLLTASG